MTDSGLEFANKTAKELANRLNINWKYSSPYHHNTVGCVERAIQSFMRKLRALTNFNETNVRKFIPKATRSLNISYHRAINTSPFIMKYGKEPELDIDKEFNVQPNIISKPKLSTERDRHWSNYSERNIIKGQKQLKNNFDVGESVMIFNQQMIGKLNKNWIQGYKVLGKIPPDAYIVSNGKSKLRLNKMHIRKFEEIN